MANITSNTDGDKAWYEDFIEPEYGIVSGLSNAAFLGIILGSLLFVCGIGALIYYCKRKKELEKQLVEKEGGKATSDNQVAPSGDIYEEMEGEIERHEQQKQKLQKYLSYLLNKDGQGLMTANQKRMAVAARARQNNNWF